MALLPLLGGVASGLFGLFGRKSSDKSNLEATRETNAANDLINRRSLQENRWINAQSIRQDDKRIRDTVKDALAAGINPLTALGTGTGGYSASGTPGQIGAIAPPPLSHGNEIGQTISTIFNELDPVQQEKEQIELGLMRAKLNEVQRNTAVVRDRNFGYSIPHATNYTGADHAGNTTRGNNNQNLSGDYDNGRDSDDRYKPDPLYVGGVEVVEDQNFSDAEEIERRYGDIGGALYGIPVAITDFYRTAKRDFKYQMREYAKRKGAPSRPKMSRSPYNPALNPPLRAYYGPHGSRTGF